MRVTAADVFTSFYDAFHDLEKLNPAEDNPEAIEEAQKQIEYRLGECSKLLDKYVDGRIAKYLALKQIGPSGLILK